MVRVSNRMFTHTQTTLKTLAQPRPDPTLVDSIVRRLIILTDMVLADKFRSVTGPLSQPKPSRLLQTYRDRSSSSGVQDPTRMSKWQSDKQHCRGPKFR